MMTPRQKYESDPVYRRLVDTFEHMLHQAQVTPSEVREAAVLACIHYEQRRPPRPMQMTINWPEGGEPLSLARRRTRSWRNGGDEA